MSGGGRLPRRVGPPRGTFERFLEFTRQENFDPGLWSLAENGGEIAGTCLCKTVAGRREVDVVACGDRGRGLALLRQDHGGAVITSGIGCHGLTAILP